LALADILSLLGSRLAMIAIPWLVLTTTGDAMLTGIIGFAEMLPYTLIKGVSGPLIDRIGPRRVALGGDLASMVVISLVPLLHFQGLLRFETLLPIVVVVGALRGPADAAKRAMVPEVAALSGSPLERVTGVMGTIDRLAGAVGAGVAGLLITALGAAPAIIATAGAYLLAAATIFFGLSGERTPAVEAEPVRQASYAVDLREGWRFFRADPVLVSIAAMIAVTNLIDQALFSVLMPVWANSAGDATLLGTLLAVFSAAAVVGSVLATWLGQRLPRLMVYTIAFLICGAPRFLVFAFDTSLAAKFLVLAATGLASGFLNPVIEAVMFERTPAFLVGRVTALMGALTWALIPFGGLFGGALIGPLGLSATFAGCGLIYFVVTMAPLAVPSFRTMGRAAQMDPGAPSSLASPLSPPAHPWQRPPVHSTSGSPGIKPGEIS
jgi:MFS family permease